VTGASKRRSPPAKGETAESKYLAIAPKIAPIEPLAKKLIIFNKALVFAAQVWRGLGIADKTRSL